jgi:hypothetical protein
VVLKEGFVARTLARINFFRRWLAGIEFILYVLMFLMLLLFAYDKVMGG